MLSSILTDNRIATDIKCSSWRDAVRACGQLLIGAGDVEEPFVNSMIETVEEFGPYMILVPEIALFHGRPSEAVHRPCLSLVVLSEPVIFDDFGGEIIRCAFGLGAVDNESHIGMLTQVAELLKNNSFLEMARGNSSKESISAMIQKY